MTWSFIIQGDSESEFAETDVLEAIQGLVSSDRRLAGMSGGVFNGSYHPSVDLMDSLPQDESSEGVG